MKINKWMTVDKNEKEVKISKEVKIQLTCNFSLWRCLPGGRTFLLLSASFPFDIASLWIISPGAILARDLLLWIIPVSVILSGFISSTRIVPCWINSSGNIPCGVIPSGVVPSRINSSSITSSWIISSWIIPPWVVPSWIIPSWIISSEIFSPRIIPSCIAPVPAPISSHLSLPASVPP